MLDNEMYSLWEQSEYTSDLGKKNRSKVKPVIPIPISTQSNTSNKKPFVYNPDNTPGTPKGGFILPEKQIDIYSGVNVNTGKNLAIKEEIEAGKKWEQWANIKQASENSFESTVDDNSWEKAIEEEELKAKQAIADKQAASKRRDYQSAEKRYNNLSKEGRLKYDEALRSSYKDLLTRSGAKGIDGKLSFLGKINNVQGALDSELSKISAENLPEFYREKFNTYLKDIESRATQFQHTKTKYKDNIKGIKELLKQDTITAEEASRFIGQKRIDSITGSNQSKSRVSRMIDKIIGNSNHDFTDQFKGELQRELKITGKNLQEVNRALKATVNGDNSGYENVKGTISENRIEKERKRRMRGATEKAPDKKFGKGIFGVAMGVLGLAGVTSMMFAGGHRSNAELYNANPQPQYYS